MSYYGAVDIGSNSVRMQAAEVIGGEPARILAEDRQVTRLGASVFREGVISPDAMRQTGEVLARMAKVLQEHKVIGVRAVATSAVRDARNQEEFLEMARQALGAPVEVISGQEEARLIHLGVQARWPHPKEKILIVDIGGGSVEIIQSRAGDLTAAFSKPLGAVRLTEVFLQHEPPTAAELRALDEYIQEKLAPALDVIGTSPHDRTVATAATAAAVVCAVRKVPRSKREQVDRFKASKPQLDKLFSSLAKKNLEQRRKIAGIGPRRAELIVAGCAVLRRFLEEFQQPALYYSAAGVRDGVIADLYMRGVGMEAGRLSRDQLRAVRAMAERYSVPLKHADKVAAMAVTLFESLRPLHRLPVSCGRLLQAAAYLHDVGHYISDTRHHKHSYYVVANSDLAGFTDRERLIVANLCRYHRKALPAPNHDNYKTLDADERNQITSLIPLLRLADSLDLGREQRVEEVRVQLDNGKVGLALDASGDIELETWAAQRVDLVFQQVYGRPLAVYRGTKEGL